MIDFHFLMAYGSDKIAPNSQSVSGTSSIDFRLALAIGL